MDYYVQYAEGYKLNSEEIIQKPKEMTMEEAETIMN